MVAAADGIPERRICSLLKVCVCDVQRGMKEDEVAITLGKLLFVNIKLILDRPHIFTYWILHVEYVQEILSPEGNIKLEMSHLS